MQTVRESVRHRPGWTTESVEFDNVCVVLHLHYIYAFSQSDLQYIQVIHFFVSMCVFPGNWTHNLLHC